MIDEKDLDKADGFLTKLKAVLKKHWGILTFLAVLGAIYWAFNLPDAPAETDQEQVIEPDSAYYEESAEDSPDSVAYYQDSVQQD